MSYNANMSHSSSSSSSSTAVSGMASSSGAGGMSAGGMSAGGVAGGMAGGSEANGMGGGIGAGGKMIRQSGINARTFIISRVDPNARSSRKSVSSRSSMGGGMGGGMAMSAGLAEKMSAVGISGFKDERAKEKQEMKALNERLAGYIEKVHFLGAENNRLEAENEALRNRKTEDLQPIRDTYESELAQARKVIDQMSSKDGLSEAKVVGLNDEIERLQELIMTYEAHAVDYRKKLAMMDSQIGDLEAELVSLRRRAGSRDDESDKQRELITKYQAQIKNLRADLENETAEHIDAEVKAQSSTEEASFYKELLDQLELMKPEPIKIKGVDAAQFWQNNMKKAIREIQQTCDEKVHMIQEDQEAKLMAQVGAMQAGTMKDNMLLVNSKEEVTKLRGQLTESKTAYSELQSQIAVLQAERDSYSSQVSTLEVDLDEQRIKYDGQIQSLQGELTAVMEQLKTVTSASLGMQLELATFQSMLDNEDGFSWNKGGIGGGSGAGGLIGSDGMTVTNNPDGSATISMSGGMSGGSSSGGMSGGMSGGSSAGGMGGGMSGGMSGGMGGGMSGGMGGGMSGGMGGGMSGGMGSGMSGGMSGGSGSVGMGGGNMSVSSSRGSSFSRNN